VVVYNVCIFSEYFGFSGRGFGRGGMRGRGGRMMVRKFFCAVCII